MRALKLGRCVGCRRIAVAMEPCQAERGAQLRRPRTLPPRDVERRPEAPLRLVTLAGVPSEDQLAAQPLELCLDVALAVALHGLESGGELAARIVDAPDLHQRL